MTDKIKSGGNVFKTLEEAIEAADEVIDVDFDFPERNNQGLFIAKTDKVKTNKELISKLRILIPDIIDLRDCRNVKGMIVCGGRAFFVVRPNLPFFLVNKTRSMFDVEEDPCERTCDDMKSTMNKIKKDDSRSLRSMLVVFASDISLTPDFTDTIPRKDKKCKLWLRIVDTQAQEKLEPGESSKSARQCFHPCHWEARILVGERVDELTSDEESDDNIAAAMKGQKGVSRH